MYYHCSNANAMMDITIYSLLIIFYYFAIKTGAVYSHSSQIIYI